MTTRSRLSNMISTLHLGCLRQRFSLKLCSVGATSTIPRTLYWSTIRPDHSRVRSASTKRQRTSRKSQEDSRNWQTRSAKRTQIGCSTYQRYYYKTNTKQRCVTGPSWKVRPKFVPVVRRVRCERLPCSDLRDARNLAIVLIHPSQQGFHRL
jgi:hypothetical protein